MRVSKRSSFFLMVLSLSMTNSVKANDASDSCYEGIGDQVITCFQKKINEATKIYKDKRVSFNEYAKQTFSDNKTYNEYVKVENKANNVWLKYVEQECYLNAFREARKDSPGFNIMRLECTLKKYKDRISYFDGTNQ